MLAGVIITIRGVRECGDGWTREDQSQHNSYFSAKLKKHSKRRVKMPKMQANVRIKTDVIYRPLNQWARTQ